MESTPNKIAMEKKGQWCRIRAARQDKNCEKKKLKKYEKLDKSCNSEVSNSFKTLDREIR